MSRIYVPTTGVENWQALLADPVKHWKTGYSAKSLAYSWEEAQGFPAEIKELFASAPEQGLKDIELLLAIPEHKVPLPGGSTQSQNDVFVLGKANGQLVSIAIEGKVSEPFGPTVSEWIAGGSSGKHERLGFLKEVLGIAGEIDPAVRYQLLHRTASAIIEAKRFNATKAVMVVHSFSQTSEWFEDYMSFLKLFGVVAQVGELVGVGVRDGIELYLGWVEGAERYLGK
ncbi:MAG: hypothetical protein GQ578_03690 [Desulfuromonadaceae bacterium]|nr:hypothetical protein [Desulfuromonadaceae bacterium]